MSAIRGIPSLAFALAVSACASTPIALPIVETDPAAANERILASVRLEEGCHDCLLEARRLLSRQLTGADSVAIAQQVFEIDLLLLLRAKELGMPHSLIMDRARSSAMRAGGGESHTRLLRIVDAVAPDFFAVPLRTLDTLRAA